MATKKKKPIVPEDFSARSIVEIYDQFVQGIPPRKAPDIKLDMSSVERVDSLALQLLVSLQKSCEAKKGTLVIENPSDIVTQVSEQLGLSNTLFGSKSE
ncbi:MAG: STAS domain-containing protein [Alphaproteobacteria bacterium]|nr:STAS domain-containing protein [Alphaproteobacteria bacterium]